MKDREIEFVCTTKKEELDRLNDCKGWMERDK